MLYQPVDMEPEYRVTSPIEHMIRENNMGMMMMPDITTLYPEHPHSEQDKAAIEYHNKLKKRLDKLKKKIPQRPWEYDPHRT